MNNFIKSALAISVSGFFSCSSIAADELVVWEDVGKSSSIEKAVSDFEKECNCKVTLKEVSSVEQYNEYSKAQNKPDVFILISDRLSDAVHSNSIVPLEYMNDDKSLYAEAAINAFHTENKIWASPRSFESLVIYYNKDVMDYPFETFDEYIDYAKKAKANDRYGLIAKLDNFYFAYGLISGNGGYTFGLNPDGSFNENDIGLNNSGAIKGLELIKEYSSNYLPPKLLTDEGWGLIDELFISGKAAAVISGPWDLDKYAKAGVNYGLAPLPRISSDSYIKPFYGAKGYVVSSESKNQDLAKRFLRFINRPSYAMMRYLSIAELPPLNEVLTNPLITNDDFANALANQIKHADLMPAIPRMGKVWGAMASCLSDVISGKTDAKTAADNAVASIKED